MQRPLAIESLTPFRDPDGALAGLDAYGAGAALLSCADVALVLDAEGVIVDVAHGGVELAREGVSDWVGRRWIDTVAEDSRVKISEMLAYAAGETPSPARQVNHVSPRAADLPVSYRVLPIGDTGRRLAVGRELRSLSALQERIVEAHHATEREYARLRDAEMRYRLLFQIASESLLIVDAGARRIVEANPAAEAALGRGVKRLVGRAFPVGFAPDEAQTLEQLLARARSSGRADPVSAKLADGGPAQVSASMFRQDATAFILVRVAREGAPASLSEDERVAASVIAAAPDAYVVTDAEGSIRAVNAAFLSLAQLATEEQATDEALDRFLGRPGVDLAILLSTLKGGGVVRQFTTSLRGEFGSLVDVEICATRADGSAGAVYGFLIRSVEDRAGQRSEGVLPRSVEQLTELVGRVPLKDLVRETTDVIERLCIEAALELSGDNRASAAEMLGLSRQSLYVKMRRYGLGDLDSGE